MKGWLLGVAAGAGLLVLAALVVVAARSTTRVDRSEECRFHLMRVWNALSGAEAFPSKEWDQQPKGGDFWVLSRSWPGARIPIDPADLRCPVKGSEGGVDYRGPARSLRLLKSVDAIAADKPGNHPVRGNVLLKNGELIEADDGAWSRAAETTCD